MRRWLKRIAALFLLLVIGIAGYAAYALGHPGMPADTQTLPAASTLPKGLSAQYFGATTLVFRDEKNAVMIDALLTRPGMGKVMFGTIASDPARVDWALGKAQLGSADLLLITHSHYDHVLDAAAVATRTGAKIAGSSSTREVMLGSDIPEARTIIVKGGEQLEAGDFRVTVIRSRHSEPDTVPGEVTAPIHQPASAKDFKEGGTFAYLIEHRGLRILVHASANFVPGMYEGVKADVIFLATGGLTQRPADFTTRYWQEIVTATGAKIVIPIHWDDFLAPLDKPLKPLPRMLDNIPETMKRLAPLAARDHVAIRYMPVIAPVDIVAAAR